VKRPYIESIDTCVQIYRRQVDYTKIKPVLVHSYQQLLKDYSEFLVSIELFLIGNLLYKFTPYWKYTLKMIYRQLNAYF